MIEAINRLRDLGIVVRPGDAGKLQIIPLKAMKPNAVDAMREGIAAISEALILAQGLAARCKPGSSVFL